MAAAASTIELHQQICSSGSDGSSGSGSRGSSSTQTQQRQTIVCSRHCNKPAAALPHLHCTRFHGPVSLNLKPWKSLHAVTSLGALIRLRYVPPRDSINT